MQKYQVISRKQDIGRLISGLHREEFLAIGIMDTGSREDLDQTLDWYRKNFNYCLHVITQDDRISQDEMQEKYPDVTFITFFKSPSLAERANALADVCMTTYFLLTRSDISLMSLDWNAITKVMKKENHPAMVCPIVFNKNNELIPTIRTPHMRDQIIDPLSFMPKVQVTENLYPFLGLGLYDRALFQRLRGYDEEVSGAYWQALDFGTRCWLYGYPIYTVTDMAMLFYSKQFLIEDRSEQNGVQRFYTKALCVRMLKGRTFAKKAYQTDKKVLSKEVKPRISLYKTDFATLCSSWKNPE